MLPPPRDQSPSTQSCRSILWLHYSPTRTSVRRRICPLTRLEPKLEDGHLKRIDCVLRTYRLSWLPLHGALSYTWGNPFDSGQEGCHTDWAANRYEITINHQPFDMAENFSGALGACFTADGEHTPCPLTNDHFWIDAIWINQSDPDDRRDQVKLMKIYSSAKEVIVCLAVRMLTPETL